MSRLISISQMPSDGYTEPVTLEDTKGFLKIDFADDDDLITALITSARVKCEKILGLVLIDTNIAALYRASHNEAKAAPSWGNWVYGSQHRFGMRVHKRRYELFYGPILEESGVPAITGLPDDAEIKGHGKSVWVETECDELDISYQSGWGAAGIPAGIKTAIMKQAAWDYQHRGDEPSIIRKGGIATMYETSISPETSALLAPYRITMTEILL